MNYHGQIGAISPYLKICVLRFVAFQEIRKPVILEEFSTHPPPLRRRDTQPLLWHPAAHCLGHYLFP